VAQYENADARELQEILDAVSEGLPRMVTNLVQTIYSEEAGRNVGRAVGSLYRELINAGLPREMAVKMASDYMISLKDVMGLMNQSGGASAHGTHGGHGWHWRGRMGRHFETSGDAPAAPSQEDA
jgi:tetrahydromethanopterin S-methyltransferase subunit G